VGPGKLAERRELPNDDPPPKDDKPEDDESAEPTDSNHMYLFDAPGFPLFKWRKGNKWEYWSTRTSVIHSLK